MALSHSPLIVTSGLVLCVDTGNPRSYTGTGTTWRDAINTGYNFTLYNGINYISSELGYLTFDGVSDYAGASNNTALDTQDVTVEVWIKTNSLNQNGFWFEKGAVNTQYSLFQEGTNIVWRQANRSQYISPSANYISTSNWAQVVGTYTSGDRRIYVNGALAIQDSQTGSLTTNSSGMYIGAYGTGSGYFYAGSLSIVRVYNKVLSATEVAQNFNAIRGRYGI